MTLKQALWYRLLGDKAPYQKEPGTSGLCADCRMTYVTNWAGPAWPMYLCDICRDFRTYNALDRHQ
jgi:hypothetical protein